MPRMIQICKRGHKVISKSNTNANKFKLNPRLFHSQSIQIFYNPNHNNQFHKHTKTNPNTKPQKHQKRTSSTTTTTNSKSSIFRSNILKTNSNQKLLFPPHITKTQPILPFLNLNSISKRYHGSDKPNSTLEKNPRHPGRPLGIESKISDDALPQRSTIVFSMTDLPGSLEKALQIFTENSINLTRIESRYGASSEKVNFFVDIDLPNNHKDLLTTLESLRNNNDIIESADILGSKEVPWFPITMEEVDSLALLILEGGSDLQADHPGFNDEIYRKRRQEVADYASTFTFGDKPHKIDYTDEEIKCWSIIWNKLHPLLYKHACPQYLEAFEKLQDYCGYKENNVPQLCDVSDFLYDSTGFRLRPTAGLISSRHFLNGLAFRTFFCTQYLRHHSVPFYTPEPDVVHELVGHAPLFANPEFAKFSQEIGLASIGATDEQIVELARCYWFSVEFGLCRSAPGANDRKIYGAGILSSFGETEYCMSDEPEIRDWDCFQAAHQDYPITKYQPLYYIADSFEDAKDKLVQFAESFDKPFSVKWDDQNEKLVVDRNIRRGPRDFDDFGSYGA